MQCVRVPWWTEGSRRWVAVRVAAAAAATFQLPRGVNDRLRCGGLSGRLRGEEVLYGVPQRGVDVQLVSCKRWEHHTASVS